MRERNRRRLTYSRLQLNVQFIHARVLTRLPASPDKAELHGSLSQLGVVLRAGFPSLQTRNHECGSSSHHSRIQNVFERREVIASSMKSSWLFVICAVPSFHSYSSWVLV